MLCLKKKTFLPDTPKKDVLLEAGDRVLQNCQDQSLLGVQWRLAGDCSPKASLRQWVTFARKNSSIPSLVHGNFVLNPFIPLVEC